MPGPFHLCRGWHHQCSQGWLLIPGLHTARPIYLSKGRGNILSCTLQSAASTCASIYLKNHLKRLSVQLCIQHHKQQKNVSLIQMANQRYKNQQYTRPQSFCNQCRAIDALKAHRLRQPRPRLPPQVTVAAGERLRKHSKSASWGTRADQIRNYLHRQLQASSFQMTF